MNKDEDWLKGVRARVAFAPRSTNPYGAGRVPGPAEAVEMVKHATQWYSGWDVADIILTLHNVKEPG